MLKFLIVQKFMTGPKYALMLRIIIRTWLVEEFGEKQRVLIFFLIIGFAFYILMGLLYVSLCGIQKRFLIWI